MDKISFIDFIKEMANNIGNYSLSMLNKEISRKQYFNTSKNYDIFKIVNDNIKVNYIKNDNTLTFYTNDFLENETLHFSKIYSAVLDKDIKLVVDIQDVVNKVKDDRLPKYYATDFIYGYFKQSKYPLRSSSSQFYEGMKLWTRLVDKALHDNYFVYYFDNSKLLLVNNSNKKRYLNLYFGEGDEYEHKHLLISKKELL